MDEVVPCVRNQTEALATQQIFEWSKSEAIEQYSCNHDTRGCQNEEHFKYFSQYLIILLLH